MFRKTDEKYVNYLYFPEKLFILVSLYNPHGYPLPKANNNKIQPLIF